MEPASADGQARRASSSTSPTATPDRPASPPPRRFMDEPDEIDAMMQAMIAAARADPFFRPPFQPLSSEIHNSLLLFHHPRAVDRARRDRGRHARRQEERARAAPTSVGFTGQRLALPLREGRRRDPLALGSAGDRATTSSPRDAGSCRIVGRRKIEDGEEFVIDGRRQSFVIEHAESRHGLSAGGRPAPAPRRSPSNMTATAFALRRREQHRRGELADPDDGVAAAAMDRARRAAADRRGCSTSPHFYTRWHVMRELLALDADAALPHLRRMAASDPHPEVRAAARADARAVLRDDEEEAGLMPRVIDAADRRVDRARRPGRDAGDRRLRPARTRTISPPGARRSKKLANNRRFLADLIDRRSSRSAAQARSRDNQYSAQVIMLHGGVEQVPDPRQFLAGDGGQRGRNSGTDPFFYGVPHDHNFSFLTVGYLGPGYWSDYYEYDYEPGGRLSRREGRPALRREVAARAGQGDALPRAPRRPLQLPPTSCRSRSTSSDDSHGQPVPRSISASTSTTATIDGDPQPHRRSSRCWRSPRISAAATAATCSTASPPAIRATGSASRALQAPGRGRAAISTSGSPSTSGRPRSRQPLRQRAWRGGEAEQARARPRLDRRRRRCVRPAA